MNSVAPFLIALFPLAWVLLGGMMIGYLTKRKILSPSLGFSFVIAWVGVLLMITGLWIGYALECPPGWDAYISRNDRMFCFGWDSARFPFMLGGAFGIWAILAYYCSRK